MFRQTTKDAINGWGTVFRFITPILITISLWILGDMRNQLRDVQNEAKNLVTTTVVYNTNHLEHHRVFEINICERMSSIESILKHR
mgnify:CR=1 FL=1